MTLELCNGIIVFEAAAMLHDTDAEFEVIDSALKERRKYRGTGIWYQVPTVPVTVLKKYRGTLVHSTAHHWLYKQNAKNQKSIFRCGPNKHLKRTENQSIRNKIKNKIVTI